MKVERGTIGKWEGPFPNKTIEERPGSRTLWRGSPEPGRTCGTVEGGMSTGSKDELEVTETYWKGGYTKTGSVVNIVLHNNQTNNRERSNTRDLYDSGYGVISELLRAVSPFAFPLSAWVGWGPPWSGRNPLPVYTGAPCSSPGSELVSRLRLVQYA